MKERAMRRTHKKRQKACTVAWFWRFDLGEKRKEDAP
jgi:hypothetical protein